MFPLDREDISQPNCPEELSVCVTSFLMTWAQITKPGQLKRTHSLLGATGQSGIMDSVKTKGKTPGSSQRSENGPELWSPGGSLIQRHTWRQEHSSAASENEEAVCS